MITPAEIEKIANKESLRATQIEKDYMLSCMLTGISKDKTLNDNLIFKGGTVLKKFYFDDYRLSEDLDFTLKNKNITKNEIEDLFQNTVESVTQDKGIKLKLSDISEHQNKNIYFYISYTGPLGGIGRNKELKVDIATNELLVFEVNRLKLFEKYSDDEKCLLNCYSLEEVITDKMCCLLSRQQPRDFYDIWYLSEIEKIDMSKYLHEFESKAKYKGVNSENLENRLKHSFPIIKNLWTSNLKALMRDLPPFEQVSRELNRNLRKVFNNSKKLRLSM